MKARTVCLYAAVVSLTLGMHAHSCGGDERACTEIGCGAPFSVGFVKAGAWAEGSYLIDVTLDGVKTSCTLKLPLSESSECDTVSRGFIVSRVGSALPASQQS